MSTMADNENSQSRGIFHKCSTLSRKRMVLLGFATGFLVGVLILVPVLTLSANNENNKEVSSETRAPLIGAFNIQTFGEAKMADEFAAEYIIEILKRYDIIIVQEVRDKSGSSLSLAWCQLNSTGTPYGLVTSDRLGRTSYKEQYAFFYRTDSARPTGTLQYNDSAIDGFEREPFTVEFEYWSLAEEAMRRVCLMALHAKPEDVVAELSLLPAIMRETLTHFDEADGVIALGDFNADCSYLSQSERESLELFNSIYFQSLIGDSADTTVASSTDCAYDRAVVLGDGVKVVDARVYNFQTEFNLSESDAKRISDHYPIEFYLL